MAYADYGPQPLTDTELVRLEDEGFVGPDMSPFYHGAMSAEEAAAVLLSDQISGIVEGDDEATALTNALFEGVYLVRDDDQASEMHLNGSTNKYVVSMVHDKQVVHHRITISPLGQLMLNANGTGSSNVSQVRERYTCLASVLSTYMPCVSPIPQVGS